MFPLPIVGLALAGRILLTKNNDGQKNVKQKFPIKPNYKRRPNDVKPVTHVNPFEALLNGLNRQLSGIFQSQPNENFDQIARRFIPEGCNILTPKYPLQSKSISSGDFDGDSKNEVVVSYRHGNEIRTIILKKEDNNWYKAAEIANSGYESVSYREVVDLTGEGKKHLIIGLASRDKDAVLRGYSFEKDNFYEMFALNYNKLQVLKVPGTDRNTPEVNLAVWKREENDTSYNIELLKWNGSQLERLNDTSTYYSSNVIPYYLKKVKRQSDSPQNWYNLADSLAKAGLNRDALIACNAGMNNDLSPQLRGKFEALQSKITKI